MCKSCDNGEEDPPVPISNTEVKLFSAEDTWRAAARENRSLQVIYIKQLKGAAFFIIFIDFNVTMLYYYCITLLYTHVHLIYRYEDSRIGSLQ